MCKEKATCETCESCVYIGDGDFICDRCKDPELVIIDWQPEREACEKWSEKNA